MCKEAVKTENKTKKKDYLWCNSHEMKYIYKSDILRSKKKMTVNTNFT